MRLRWTCETCGQVIRPGRGALWCDDGAAYSCQRLEDEQTARHQHPGGLGFVDARTLLAEGQELEAAGWPVPWHVQHFACDPVERSCYWIRTEQCRTLAALLQLNEHLAAKTWIRCTDWTRFLQRVTHRPTRRTRKAAACRTAASSHSAGRAARAPGPSWSDSV